jgi:predicted RNase H-like HicB family nuclease
MKRILQARIFRGESQYVAECADLPVVTQGRTLDEVTANLKEAIALHLEGEDLSQFDLAEEPVVLASFELEAVTHAQT